MIISFALSLSPPNLLLLQQDGHQRFISGKGKCRLSHAKHTHRLHDWKMGCQVILNIIPVEDVVHFLSLCCGGCCCAVYFGTERSDLIWSYLFEYTYSLTLSSSYLILYACSQLYLPATSPSAWAFSLLFQSTIRINLSAWSSALLSPSHFLESVNTFILLSLPLVPCLLPNQIARSDQMGMMMLMYPCFMIIS